MKYYIIMLLTLFPIISHAQGEKQVLKDSIEALQSQIESLKSNLGYGTDKYSDSIFVEGEVYKCKVLRAYYDNDDVYLHVDFQFSSKSDGILKFVNRTGYDINVFCILNERFRKASSYGDFEVELKSDIPRNITLKFEIFRYFDVKPRLIEYIKLKEENTNKEFVFRNIAIDTIP